MRGKPSTQPAKSQNLSLKTMELLLINYNNLHNSMAHWKPCAEKQKFVTLIADLEADIELAESFPNTNTTQE